MHYVAHLRRTYKLTAEEYDQMVLDVNGNCAICDQPAEELVVDHDHVTKEVRGLLCVKHNLALGAFTSEEMERAIKYLAEKSNARRES